MTVKALGRFGLLLGLEALVAGLSVLAAPSESSSALLLGLSAARLGLLLLLLLLAGAGLTLFALARVEHPMAGRWRQALQSLLDGPRAYPLILVGLVAIALINSYAALLAFRFTDAAIQVRLLRLLPLLVWLALASLQGLLFLPRWRSQREEAKGHGNILCPALWALLGLVALVALIASSGLGLQPDRTGWDSPGVPLLGTQMLLAFLAAGLLVTLSAWVSRRLGWQLARIDWLAMALIWLASILLWQSQALTPTYFSPTPRAPNFEFYPYSDAAGHDLDGQSLLLGQGFDGVVEKPAYSAFLALLHALVGQDYDAVANAQIVALALFPAVLYALGLRVHSRLAGGLLAAAVILRERNAIALSGQINVSHSKLLMTDLPAALALAGLTLLVFSWLQRRDEELRWPLWAGAALGLLLLLRSQTLIFLPLLLLLALWRGGPSWRMRGWQAGFVLLGFALAALPWLLRNYQASSTFGYSQPLQMYYMAKQYSLTPEDNDPGFPPGARVEEYVALGSAQVAAFVRQHPGETARFVTAHFLHNEVSSLLALPMRFDLADRIVTFQGLLPFWEDRSLELWAQCCSLDTYIDQTPYWDNWNGTFPREAFLPLAVNLGLLALGLGAAWRRASWLGLLPLAMHLGYSASTAIARVSGWRLILPADWAILLYYSIGVAQLAVWIWAYLGGRRRAFAEVQPEAYSALPNSRSSLLRSTAVVLALAILIPLSEGLIPLHFESLEEAQAVEQWEAADAGGAFDATSYLELPGAAVLVGRAFYPRYYPAGQGEPGGDWVAFNPLPFNRLGFVLLGPSGNHVIVPLTAAPTAFPNGADVIVFGCQTEAYFRAAAVLIANGSALLADAPGATACP